MVKKIRLFFQQYILIYIFTLYDNLKKNQKCGKDTANRSLIGNYLHNILFCIYSQHICLNNMIQYERIFLGVFSATSHGSPLLETQPQDGSPFNFS